MDQFLTASFSYPTIIYATLLAIAVFYWLLTLVGVVGLDSLDFDVDADMDMDADVGGEGGTLAAASFLQRQPIRVIPLSISLSLFFFFGWLICHVALLSLGAILDGLVPRWLWGSALFFAATFVSLALANLVSVPLAPIFITHISPRKRDLVGRIVEVRTGRVDEKFGTAEAENGGAGLIIEVRCSAGKLARGDRALVIDYDIKADLYHVVPLDEAMR